MVVDCVKRFLEVKKNVVTLPISTLQAQLSVASNKAVNVE